MDKKQLQQSKLLSLVLRHAPEKIGLQLDENGWANTDDLLACLKRHHHDLSMEKLVEIVATNPKQRFAFNADQTKIRANQGHSIGVDLGLSPQKPPAVLYHGTALKYLDSIREQGLLKQQRDHVHLSADTATAEKVGQRHGKPIILTIDAEKMHEAGFVFYCADNGVWLTDAVPMAFIMA